jgi:dihydrofolate reductase
MIEFAHKINAVPKIVLSKTLEKASWNNTKLIKHDAVEEVTRLKQGDGGSIAIGGISLIQAFMKLKLIDEYWLLVQPVIWGRGRRLFEGVTGRLDHRLMDTTTFKSGVVVLHYSPAWGTTREE